MTKKDDDRAIQGYLCAAKHTSPQYERRMLEQLEQQDPRLAELVRRALDDRQRRTDSPETRKADDSARNGGETDAGW